MSDDIFLKTNVSAAMWREGKTSGAAYFPGDKGDENCICWLDVLLGGGFRIPGKGKEKRAPLSIILEGPPGSGKTTLALEICYRIAKNGSIPCVYVTSESTAHTLEKRASGFGWSAAKSVFSSNLKNPKAGITAIYTVEELEALYSSPNADAQNENTKSDYLKRFWWIIRNLPYLLKILGDEGLKEAAELVSSFVQKSAVNNAPADETESSTELGLVAFDSLVPTDKCFDAFESLLKPSLNGPKILLMVVDSSADEHHIRRWEHRCDVLIRLDRREEALNNYLIRTIEVVKARYQSHVWGKHQLKIYSAADCKTPEFHPYIEEGGIFIYPSIHFCLSRYKRRRSDQKSEPMLTPLATLNKIINGGIPRGRCTAIVGTRGAHKSHLGYYHLLNAIEDFPLSERKKDSKKGETKIKEGGLVISLRDDEGLAKKAMLQLLSTMERYGTEELAEERYMDLIDMGRLEVLYFRPGYIRPEEFYHRVLMSVLRFKAKGLCLTVLFNSLDQLSARFPLCAQEDIFVPGLIDTFSTEDVTSIFIAVNEQGQPESQYGLLPMADLILSAETVDIPRKKYLDYLDKAEQLELTPAEVEARKKTIGEGKLRTVKLRVDRFAGGQRAGAQGILELVEKSELHGHFKNKNQALAFAPFRE